MDKSLEQHWMQRARFLTQALILSGTLNIGFLSTCIYFVLKDKQAAISYEIPTEVKKQFTNEQILRAYSQASFQDLLIRLESKEKMEEGCVRRDFALACLVAFHNFPVEKVLGEAFLQKRVISFHLKEGVEPIDMTLYVGLKDEHFAALLQFAKTEKWPLTSKGLFLNICQNSFPCDPTLLDAFYCTPEFHAIYSLLQKYISYLPKPLLVVMLKEGSWSLLERFADKLRVLQSYDVETYRECLVAYTMEGSSKIAADLLWRHEMDYVLKRFDDEQILTFLQIHKDQKEKAQFIAKEILVSLRSDTIRQKAAEILYTSIEGALPSSYDYQTILHRFSPEKPEEVALITPSVAVSPPEEKLSPKKTVHLVQEGESLWKISRKYKVSVESIMKLNRLESDRLRSGKELQIPEVEKK
jgi:LysM repeat protein